MLNLPKSALINSARFLPLLRHLFRFGIRPAFMDGCDPAFVCTLAGGAENWTRTSTFSIVSLFLGVPIQIKLSPHIEVCGRFPVWIPFGTAHYWQGAFSQMQCVACCKRLSFYRSQNCTCASLRRSTRRADSKPTAAYMRTHRSFTGTTGANAPSRGPLSACGLIGGVENGNWVCRVMRRPSTYTIPQIYRSKTPTFTK